MSDDIELLRRYAEDGAEEAFRELVARHIDLVRGGTADAGGCVSGPGRGPDGVQ